MTGSRALMLLFGMAVFAAGVYITISANWATGALAMLFGGSCIIMALGTIFENNKKVYRRLAILCIALMLLLILGFALLYIWLAAVGVINILAGRWATGGIILLMFAYAIFLAMLKSGKVSKAWEYPIVIIFMLSFSILFVIAAHEMNIDARDIPFGP